MAEQLTEQQKAAVENRGGKLLVSAAAGSGKTKVLVDRLMTYLMDPVQPANLDEFLIITYTKAAAAELRGKIAKKLTEKMAENPENRHLQRQMQRLYMTKITTVHSFCSDVLKEYAYLLDLPADFRVADENECRQIREDSMAKCLDEAYTNSLDPDFRAFVDTQGLGRDDRLVPEILFKVYDSAKCHKIPQDWLDECVRNADTSQLTDAGQTIWGKYLMDALKENLRLHIGALSACVEAVQSVPFLENPVALFLDTIYQLQILLNANTWDEVVAARNVDFGRLSFSKKCPDQQLCEQMRVVRGACKSSVEKQLKTFSDPSSVVLADLQDSATAVRGMIKLAEAFEQEYTRAKRARRIMDFSDLEHKMLDLLVGKNRSTRTAAAEEVGARFREIMVDEYQDSNAVQDAIFSALTEKRQNCFMVGDVKQSIYQFRLADPEIFLKKYHDYTDADKAVDPEGRKVILSSNFRSGGGVLAGANDVFKNCMTTKFGGLEYTKDEELNEGIKHVALGEAEVELWAVDAQGGNYVEEAAFVAKRIVELTNGKHFVRDGDKLRPIKIGDIAILLRSTSSMGKPFKDALAKYGIPCSTGGGDDLLGTEEITLLRSILQTISNPRQDIPLLAALASPIFCFTAEELAQIRAERHYGSIYDALLSSENTKAKSFLQMLDTWRREARLQPLARLLESIFAQTRMDSFFAAMEDGDIRKDNLHLFYQMAADYEKMGRRDLEQFLDHLDTLEKKGLVTTNTQGATNAVTIMTIHKSKGLEFPVVFVSGLSRTFSRESVKGQVLCDQKLGLGLVAVDEKNRVRYPTIAKRAITAKIIADGLSEEMRILYVALTRARDRMIMTYASKSLEKDLSELAHRMDVGERDLLLGDAVCPGDWILMTALRRTEAGELFALSQCHKALELGKVPWLIRVTDGLESSVTAVQNEEENQETPEHLLSKLDGELTFHYSHDAATAAPSKQTATQLKGRQKDAEATENTNEKRQFRRKWRKPSFVEEKADGTVMGTATHAVMEHIHYACCADVQNIQLEVERLIKLNFITKQQADVVDCEKIAAFFQTEIGTALRNHPNVLREFKFTILDDAQQYDPALAGEEILLQGVVDCAMVDEDGITVIDFKTDYVTEETISQKVQNYQPQVQAYAEAMARIYRKPVKASWLYFFRLNRFEKV